MSILIDYPEWKCTPLQFCILSVLKEEGGWTQSELAEFLGVTRETVCKNMKKLRKRGLVRVVPVRRRNLYFIEPDRKGSSKNKLM